MRVPLGQEWCLSHQIGSILKSGTVSPSNGKIFQDRDRLPRTLRTGCYPGTRLTSPTDPHPPHAPSSHPSRPGAGRRRSAAPPTHASLVAAARLAPPRIWGWGRFVCFSFWEQTSCAFSNNHKPAPSGDPAKGSAGAEQLRSAAWPASNRGTGPGAWNPAAQGAPRPGPGRAQSQAGRRQVWDLPGRATREGPAQRQVRPAQAIWSQPLCSGMCCGCGGGGLVVVDCLPDHVGGCRVVTWPF